MTTLDNSAVCHAFARDLGSPLTVKELSYNRFHHIIYDKNKICLSQSKLDPHQWPLAYNGSINIVTSSDVHGFIHGECTNSFCTSGASSFASVLDTIRLSSSISRDPVLVFDVCDAFFGSGVDPKEIADTMNKLKYDAMALGNHDLDIGLDHFATLLDTIQFPILSANAKVKGTSLPKLIMKELALGGESIRVCVIGYTTPEHNPLAGPDGLSFTLNDTDALVLDIATTKHIFQCDVQILLSHLGIN